MNERQFIDTLIAYCDVEQRKDLSELLKQCSITFDYTSVFASKSYQYRMYIDVRALKLVLFISCLLIFVFNIGILKESIYKVHYSDIERRGTFKAVSTILGRLENEQATLFNMSEAEKIEYLGVPFKIYKMAEAYYLFL